MLADGGEAVEARATTRRRASGPGTRTSCWPLVRQVLDEAGLAWPTWTHRRRRRPRDVHRPAHRRRHRPRPGAGARGAVVGAGLDAAPLAARRLTTRSRGSAWRCSTPAAARPSPRAWRDGTAAARRRSRSRPRRWPSAPPRCPAPLLAGGRRGGTISGTSSERPAAAVPDDASPLHRVCALRPVRAGRRRRRSGAGDGRPRLPRLPTRRSPTAATSTAVTRHDRHRSTPPPHLRRPAAGHRDRAARVPDAVVAGDVRARAVQAAGICLAARRDGRVRGLPGLLPLRHGLAPDERRRRPRPPPAGHRHRAAAASCSSGSTTPTRSTRSRSGRSNDAGDRASTSASASAPPALRRRYYHDNGEDAVIMWRTPATLRDGTLDDVPERLAAGVILALETSCDDTCAAVVTHDGRDPVQRHLLAGRPRPLRRRRARGRLPPPPRAGRRRSSTTRCARPAPTLDDVELVAVTRGPGLVGALLVGRVDRQGAGRRARPAAGRRSTTCTATWPRTSWRRRRSSRRSCA